METKETVLHEDEEPTRPLEDENTPPEIAEHPIPGIKHEREPSAENIMPAEDRPGTF